MIRKRTVQFNYTPQIVAGQTDLNLGQCWVAPAVGYVRNINAYLKTKGGSNAAQLNLYRSGVAGSTAAASTTVVNTAVMNMTSDAQVTGAVTLGTSFVQGEVFYLKATTGATTTMDIVSVTMAVDY